MLDREGLVRPDRIRQAFSGEGWRRLVSDEDAPRLSLARSEASWDGVGLDRSHDVDSVFVSLTCLSALRGGFRIAYRPHFMRTITQNPRVPLGPVAIQDTPQLRLGRPI